MTENQNDELQNEVSEKTEKKGLEERFTSIEKVLERLEHTDVTLEESFELYKQGLEELASANAMLDEMEQAMLVMTENGELEEF